MKLYKIKNKYMYKGEKRKENSHHTYAVYKDRKTRKYRAIQLTHILEEPKRIAIEKGYLKVEKFSSIKYPSGVHDTYYDSDVNGNDLNFDKTSKHKLVGRVPPLQAHRIKKFVKKKHK